MTKAEFAALAKKQCETPELSPCNGCGKTRPFWNPHAYQFMYAPVFSFSELPGKKKYLYTLIDENGGKHSFETDNTNASLAPVWPELPEGVVSLTVNHIHSDGSMGALCGARTFFKLASFPDDLPPKARSYTEAGLAAYDHIFSQSYIQHWLTDGTPDPDYDHYVYPNKMIAAIVNSMLRYAEYRPEKADDAVAIAVAAADYLIAHSRKENEHLAFLPLTYQIDFRDHPETRKNHAAASRLNTIMMIYPAGAGSAYLKLEEKTGDKKYFDAAMRIAEFYKENVLENGSWPLVMSLDDGKPTTGAFCYPIDSIVPFLRAIADRTGDESWNSLAAGAVRFVEQAKLAAYDWEGQFEDSSISVTYDNLSHYSADGLILYYLNNFRDDEKKMAIAADLTRFVEDQFVVWKRPAPWNYSKFDTSLFITPCGYEQYKWHVPIDASTSKIATVFTGMYKATGDELYLEKAKALADSITRVQHENGYIPTHWMSERHRNGSNTWINCMLSTATFLLNLGKLTNE